MYDYGILALGLDDRSAMMNQGLERERTVEDSVTMNLYKFTRMTRTRYTTNGAR